MGRAVSFMEPCCPCFDQPVPQWISLHHLRRRAAHSIPGCPRGRQCAETAYRRVKDYYQLMVSSSSAINVQNESK